MNVTVAMRIKRMTDEIKKRTKKIEKNILLRCCNKYRFVVVITMESKTALQMSQCSKRE